MWFSSHLVKVKFLYNTQGLKTFHYFYEYVLIIYWWINLLIITIITNRNGGEPVTREDAFVSSITSAAIVYAVTRACTKGTLTTCGCAKRGAPILLGNKYAKSENTKSEWTWSGCSDDVSFGDQVALTFLTSLQEGQADVLAKVHLHNNRLGRLVGWVLITFSQASNCVWIWVEMLTNFLLCLDFGYFYSYNNNWVIMNFENEL